MTADLPSHKNFEREKKHCIIFSETAIEQASSAVKVSFTIEISSMTEASSMIGGICEAKVIDVIETLPKLVIDSKIVINSVGFTC